MGHLKHFLAAAAAVSLTNAALAGTTVEYSFTQSGFAGGGTISGTFSGKDLDDDGQLYAMGIAGVDFLGLPFGNELEYAEVTFDGFNTIAPFTLIYDSSVADMTDFSNFFMAFSYNLDGGSFGDDPDEGFSFSFFAPSTNYILGAAFSDFVNPIPIGNPIFGACGTGDICAGVVEFEPNPLDPSGVDVVYASYSRDLVATTAVVPLPGAAWLFLSGMGVIGAMRGRRPNG